MKQQWVEMKLTKNFLIESITQDTPEFTKKLLMELNPQHWGKYFPELRPSLKLLKQAKGELK